MFISAYILWNLVLDISIYMQQTASADDIFRYILLLAGDEVIYTVNSEIFARVLFSQNFACAKFRENKILAKWKKIFCRLLI